MAKVSVLIPSRNERFLPQTINDVLTKATGDIECIAVLDSYWPDPPLPDRPNLTIIHRSKAMGMRAAINAAAAAAKGKYLLKCDAHCMFAPGFDEILQADCDDNWIVIPRRYSLDAENWTILETGKAPVDYHFLCYPHDKKDNDPGMHGRVWNERARERKDKPEFDIDDEMSFQGSCWMMQAKHFHEHLGGMSEEGYGSFIQEPQEIGLKTWLGGGAVKVCKRTWYSHLHKGTKYGRGYSISKREMVRGSAYSTDFWINNRWTERQRDISWLIQRFWPVPSWPDNWEELVYGHP